MSNAGDNDPENLPSESATEDGPSNNTLIVAEIRREIDTAIIEAVSEEKLPAEIRATVVDRVTEIVAAEIYTGPLPHPRHLKQYNEILPGAADRILRMAEKEQEHRHSREHKIIDGQIEHGKRGQRYGLAAMLGTIIGALVSEILGYPVVAGAFLASAALSVVIAFIRGELNIFPQPSKQRDNSTNLPAVSASSLSTAAKSGEPPPRE